MSESASPDKRREVTSEDVLNMTLPKLQALYDELAEARFRPIGDNHHNALACPYCTPSHVAPKYATPPFSEADRIRQQGPQAVSVASTTACSEQDQRFKNAAENGDIPTMLRLWSARSAMGTYTPDQQRAANYIAEAGIGGGDDPVGFLIASHAFLAKDAARYRWLRDKSEPGICAFYLSVGAAFHKIRFKPQMVDEAIDDQINRPDGGKAS